MPDDANLFFPVDKSQVPPERRADPRLTKMEEEMQPLWRDENYRLSVCLHEAAHADYLIRAGVSRLLFNIQMARYNSGADEFGIGDAAIIGEFGDVRPSDRLSTARVWVAGGVAQRCLINGPLGAPADATDREEFEVEAAAMGLTPEGALELWTQATRDVEGDLRKPKFRQHMWNVARTLEESWLRMVSDNVTCYEFWSKSDLVV